MKIIEFDGNAFGTDYAVSLLDGGSVNMPGVQAIMVQRLGQWPLLGGVRRPGHRLFLGIVIEGASKDTLRVQLQQWFDPEDETPKKLTAADDDGSSNERYLYTICESLQVTQSREGGVLVTMYVATLAIHGDVRWRHETEDSDVWNITASGQTNVVANGGDDDVYPRFTIEPTSGKTGGYGYKRFVAVRWRVEEASSDYPYELSDGGFDTATLVSGGKAQSDGDDFRVMVDGVEVDRWFGAGSYAFNQATTKIWVNLDFEADVSMTLKTAIAASGSISEIELNEAITGLPASGILLIDSEVFVYTGKSDADKKVTGVTRAAKGTSMAAHTASTAVYWLQHDIWYLYDNSTATAPTVDDDMEPAFELDDSTNTSWVYEEFGGGTLSDPTRTRRWGRTDNDYAYTANHVSNADPWTEIGLREAGQALQWQRYSPCGITAANFQNGEKYAQATGSFSAEIRSSINGATWATEYTIPDVSVANTWESWSQNETLDSGSKYVALWLDSFDIYSSYRVEAADVTLTFNSSNTPTTAFTGSEQGAYPLACTLTNNTTGESIEFSYLMGTNEELEVDTYEKTVTDLEDDSQQMQALTLVGGARRHWLKLQPGNNTLQFDDTGTVAVTLTTEFAKRSYG